MTTTASSAPETYDTPASRVPGVTTGDVLDGRVPDGSPATAWARRKLAYKLVNPANRRKFKIIVVGTGLAGSGAAAALGELGYDVHSFTYHDAPRRAHSVAAQGGINAARARKVDNDSIERFVTDTVKGGDFRGREVDAFRLGEESVRVIDHLNAIGAPFAREYGGALATRSFGGVQVSRTYYTRGQTGQQLQVASAQALLRQVDAGTVTLRTRHEMLDLIIDDGRARGVIMRNLLTGEITSHTADAVVLATGGYGNVFYFSTLAKNSNASAAWRATQRGALFASPSFIQFHPTALPVSSRWQSKTILMSESLRNDGRIWVPLAPGDERAPNDIPEGERDYYLERRYPTFGNLTPRDVASRNASEQITAGRGVGPLKNSVYLDFRDAIARLGAAKIAERYGNLFEMYTHATGEDPYKVPMRIAPGAHFTMGGLWSDYDQMTSIPGLFVGGEAGWGYHGANRLGANSLLSACVDGWFTLPYSIPNYLAPLLGQPRLADDGPAAREALARARSRVDSLLAVDGQHGPTYFHRLLGDILYAGCGVHRTAETLTTAITAIRELRERFWTELRVAGTGDHLNQELERAGRVADYLELAELMCVDALDREESCGAHFRGEHQVDGEAARDDELWAFVSAWEAPGDGTFVRHHEPLSFDAVPLQKRNYR
ncbi:fumarate reductase/succinate dehydrogenase flavoprotein subunit [Cellulomonas chengniuliangii]|uniref:fumarate reductase/succinate dehydrogenase flavoprotein subunit n=1 Tax=Cellulomonas chengniuliangii TaxID=2968084 RepID=UPI001D0F3A44|nr:fumarate reductase/succinate dehydrogenase flavoprotein subunit [Cellulomonas chengniuliangii]MCC2317442.1 fumarate reductase/succinate dehydrogenase flavoprotein subunit [Cellulomonas chengniuliangii]